MAVLPIVETEKAETLSIFIAWAGVFLALASLIIAIINLARVLGKIPS